MPLTKQPYIKNPTGNTNNVVNYNWPLGFKSALLALDNMAEKLNGVAPSNRNWSRCS